MLNIFLKRPTLKKVPHPSMVLTVNGSHKSRKFFLSHKNIFYIYISPISCSDHKSNKNISFTCQFIKIKMKLFF